MSGSAYLFLYSGQDMTRVMEYTHWLCGGGCVFMLAKHVQTVCEHVTVLLVQLFGELRSSKRMYFINDLLKAFRVFGS
jgi:hypothetical protein